MKNIPNDLPLAKKAAALIEGETNAIANMANLSALIYDDTPHINWVGFYIFDGKELVLGPFQGKYACVRIPIGKGVCGTAADKKETLLVPNVHDFEGHIACDSQTNSEIVIPVLKPDGSIYGVLDVDSPLPDRFGKSEREILEEIVKIFERTSDL